MVGIQVCPRLCLRRHQHLVAIALLAMRTLLWPRPNFRMQAFILDISQIPSRHLFNERCQGGAESHQLTCKRLERYHKCLLRRFWSFWTFSNVLSKIFFQRLNLHDSVHHRSRTMQQPKLLS